MKHEMEQVRTTFGNEILLFHVDIDRWPSVATKLEVTLTPTLLVFQEGQVKLRMEGMVSTDVLLEEIRTILGQ